jgi:ketosteroid isomerase-like protein
MPRVLRLIIVSLTASFVLQGCAVNPVSAVDAEKKVVESYLSALSQRDMRLLTLYVTPDVEWYSVSDGERTLESSGREQLIELLNTYFSRYPVTRWQAQQMIQSGQTVAINEQSQWGDTVLQTRTALGVFELDKGRIRRLTYYLDAAE